MFTVRIMLRKNYALTTLSRESCVLISKTGSIVGIY
jgi:hypothetical protein